jgi:two-component system, OmpR family, response regulator VanR
MRVLVVEDTQTLANAIARGLRREGMAVDVVYDGWSALEAVAEPVYDVIVLDRDLPEVSGDDVCRALRQESSPSRVLMLTASGTTADLVEGLGLGADDYLSKPFRFAELVARIRALARRTGPTLPVQHRRGDLVVDITRRSAVRAGRRIPLTAKEWAVLQVLVEADGAVVSSEQLLVRAWDAGTEPLSNTVRVTVSTLRRKLGDPPLIETVVGAGYQLPVTPAPG